MRSEGLTVPTAGGSSFNRVEMAGGKMRYVCLVLILAGACLVGIALTRVQADDVQGKAKPEPDSKAGDTPLLLLDDEPPLLLDEPGEAAEKPSGADNSRCHVCHLNFALEEIAAGHAKKGIGCADCHGDCDAHIDDESWASGGPGTPPGIMYPRQSIDPACGECHDTHNAPAREVLKRWQERCSRVADVSKVVCTDCHGNHRVNPKLRKAWWGKNTGKPIPRNSGKRIEADTSNGE
jgi:hypothetical protein